MIKRNKKKLTRIFYNLTALVIIIGVFVIFAWSSSQMSSPIADVEGPIIDLQASHLPNYAIRTVTRMFLAVIISFIFTILYATLAAKNKKAGQIMIPILDILQSVPILGYISFAMIGFIRLFPGSTMGPEAAAIFVIFTSQAWNMTFSLYQSLSNLPQELNEASAILRLSAWQKFWRVELPFATPSLVYNTMMSMSGGWFFVVASEAISIGNQEFSLPGIGSYIALAITNKDVGAITNAIITMIIVIAIYDQLFFRPLVVWSEKFRYELTSSDHGSSSWVLKLFQKSSIITTAKKLFFIITRPLLKIKLFNAKKIIISATKNSEVSDKYFDYLWYICLFLIVGFAAIQLANSLYDKISLAEIIKVTIFGLITALRVMVLIILASILWVPVGVYIGLRPKLAEFIQPLAQFLAAFPANLLFPIAVITISSHNLNPNIWLSFLMIFGTQWYILFNVIAGASSFPNDLKEVVKNYKIKGFFWWKKIILPAVMPYFLTGAMTAAGGAWNASVVSEIVRWGRVTLHADGIGSYISMMTDEANYYHIALGIIIMSLMVLAINSFVWNPLHKMAAKKFRFD
jgi:NitT/TauT family transport system permease protein